MMNVRLCVSVHVCVSVYDCVASGYVCVYVAHMVNLCVCVCKVCRGVCMGIVCMDVS